VSPYRTAALAAPATPAAPRFRGVARRLGADSILADFRWFRRVYGGRWSLVTGCGGAQSWLRFEECPAKTRWCGRCSDAACALKSPDRGECSLGRCVCEVYG